MTQVPDIDRGALGDMHHFLVPEGVALPERIGTTVAFGGQFKSVRRDVVAAAEVSKCVIASGRTGGDSGSGEVIEADWQAEPLGPHPGVVVERHARTGVENAIYVVRMMKLLDPAVLDVVVGVAPVLTASRLNGGLRRQAHKRGVPVGELIALHSGEADMDDPRSQFKIAKEIDLLDRLGRRSMVDVPRLPSAEMTETARKIAVVLGRYFEDKGIRNTSTAIGTDPSVSPVRLMLTATPGAETRREVVRARAGNVVGVARAGLRQWRATGLVAG